MNTKLISELETILNSYAEDSNYSTTTRQCEWISNGVTEETFYEFDGDSTLAKRGLEIIIQLKANQQINSDKKSNAILR